MEFLIVDTNKQKIYKDDEGYSYSPAEKNNEQFVAVVLCIL